MQIELYNTLLEKEGTDGEEDAKKLYRAARDEAAEVASGDKVTSALQDKVRTLQLKRSPLLHFSFLPHFIVYDLWFYFLLL